MSRISIAILAAAVWLAAPLAAHAVGLGRLSVLSPLGQPLNAEIEVVSLQPSEEDGLNARLAPFEAFRQAGIDPSPALTGARFTLERRDGRAFIRLTTPQPVSEPFLDLLVELQWNGGRLVREYTLLLDPPEYKGPQAIAAAPQPKPAVAPQAQPLPPMESKPQAQPAAPEPAAVSAAPAAAPAPATTYEVKQGDTLGAIARAHLPPGVTLNQMLISLYRANQDAFLRENVNLVRAGRLLTIPGGDEVGTLDVAEANRLVQAHHAEFNEYRSRLAAVPAQADAATGQQAVAGTIETQPQAPAPEAPQDQLRLSKADPDKASAPAARAAQGDDAAARERALAEAQSRVTDLEKNVADLRKLLELKNQQLAELEKKANAQAGSEQGAPQAAPAPAAPAPAKPEAVQPEAPKPEAPKPEAPRPDAATPEAAQPATPQVEAPKPAPQAETPKPAPQPTKPRVITPPPAPPPSLVDEFLENPIALAGLGAVLLLLIGYGVWSWRRKKASQAKFQDSVLGAAAAGAAAGAGAEPSQVSVSQPVAGMEAEEVDPIQEADVYMAYGRDAQAEEILKEALQKDPKRVAVLGKLLEIYANRKDTRSFEETALKLKGVTGGTGAEWDKAATLGRSIDPANGLYGGASVAAAAAAGAAASPALDFDLGGAASDASTPDITLDEKTDTGAAAIDFDLGAPAAPEEPKAAPEEKEKSDFTPEGTLIMDQQQPESTLNGLDFDLGLGDEEKKPQAAPAAAAAPAPEASGGLDFDLNLDLGGGEPEKAAQAESPAPTMDLSDISLDLGSAGEPSAGSGAGADPRWQEVATKLDLAKAYEEMGDKDGARELLNEVVKDGDDSQKGQAEQLLAKLG